jgi:hypothetical protein
MRPVSDIEAHWQELLTVALLGTDRRDPPTPPDGPVGDVVADAVRDEPSSRMLADVAACAAVRRAAFVPGPPAGRLAPPAHDPRPLCPPAAVATWRELSEQWPVLVDEWVLTVVQRGWRLPADVAVELLAATRRDPVRHARVVRAAGPAADWVTDHVPDLRRPSRATSRLQKRSAVNAPAAETSSDGDEDHEHEVLSLPPLAVPPDLEPLLVADAHTFVSRLLPGFHEGRFGASHRPVLVNLVARCRPEVLPDAAGALDTVDPWSPSSGLAHLLADLARSRTRLHTHLQ